MTAARASQLLHATFYTYRVVFGLKLAYCDSASPLKQQAASLSFVVLYDRVHKESHIGCFPRESLIACVTSDSPSVKRWDWLLWKS